MSTQLMLFSADRYHDPRVSADRARERSLAKLRPVSACRRVEPVCPGTIVLVCGEVLGAQVAASDSARGAA